MMPQPPPKGTTPQQLEHYLNHLKIYSEVSGLPKQQRLYDIVYEIEILKAAIKSLHCEYMLLAQEIIEDLQKIERKKERERKKENKI